MDAAVETQDQCSRLKTEEQVPGLTFLEPLTILRLHRELEPSNTSSSQGLPPHFALIPCSSVSD